VGWVAGKKKTFGYFFSPCAAAKIIAAAAHVKRNLKKHQIFFSYFRAALDQLQRLDQQPAVQVILARSGPAAKKFFLIVNFSIDLDRSILIFYDHEYFERQIPKR